MGLLAKNKLEGMWTELEAIGTEFRQYSGIRLEQRERLWKHLDYLVFSPRFKQRPLWMGSI